MSHPQRVKTCHSTSSSYRAKKARGTKSATSQGRRPKYSAYHRPRYRPFDFPRVEYIKYSFFVVPLHIVFGMALCYVLSFYMESLYAAHFVNVSGTIRKFNVRLNDMMPMLLSIVLLKILSPLRTTFLFLLSGALIRLKEDYVDRFLLKLADSFINSIRPRALAHRKDCRVENMNRAKFGNSFD